jgi:hypothetical protein
MNGGSEQQGSMCAFTGEFPGISQEGKARTRMIQSGVSPMRSIFMASFSSAAASSFSSCAPAPARLYTAAHARQAGGSLGSWSCQCLLRTGAAMAQWPQGAGKSAEACLCKVELAAAGAGPASVRQVTDREAGMPQAQSVQRPLAVPTAQRSACATNSAAAAIVLGLPPHPLRHCKQGPAAESGRHVDRAE